MNLKRKLGFRKSLTVGLMFIVTCFFLFNGCEKDEYELDLLDKVILNSSELEEYIIAGADLKHSLAIFESRMNKIDFSKLEVTYDAKGRKVVHLPIELVSNVIIEEKVHVFNEKKEAIQNEFPQFVSFRKDEAKKYFHESIKNSVNVIGEFFKLGINFSGSRLKSANEYGGAEDEVILFSDLAAWVTDPNYVEIRIFYFADGSMQTHQHADATYSYAGKITYQVINGDYYYNNKQLVGVGHTHLNSSNASEADLDNNYPSSVELFIYYNGTYTYYQ